MSTNVTVEAGTEAGTEGRTEPVTDSPTQDHHRAQQRALYGAPLGELIGTVAAQLGLTQAKVAKVLGVSAPMLSQLMSAQRVKFGNPSAVQRLQSLMHLAERAAELVPEELHAALDQISEEQLSLPTTRGTHSAHSAHSTHSAHTDNSTHGSHSTRTPLEERRVALQVLRASATSAQLRRASESTTGALAALLAEAADPRG